MKIVLLDAGTIGADMEFSPIQNLGECVIYNNTAPEETAKRIEDADVVIINKVLLTGEVLQFARNLKLICVFAVGYNNIDIDYAREKGIVVCNVPGYSTDSVVLFTVATALAIYAKLPTFSKYTKRADAQRIGS